MSAVSNRLMPASTAASRVASISRIGTGSLIDPTRLQPTPSTETREAVAERSPFHGVECQVGEKVELRGPLLDKEKAANRAPGGPHFFDGHCSPGGTVTVFLVGAGGPHF